MLAGSLLGIHAWDSCPAAGRLPMQNYCDLANPNGCAYLTSHAHACTTRPAKSMSDTATRAELDRYFRLIERRLPMRFSRFLRLLRRPSMMPARIAVSILLIVGGLLSFLPVLGFWMLPLGLMVIAQDLPFLQKPLVRLFHWCERRWASWRS